MTIRFLDRLFYEALVIPRAQKIRRRCSRRVLGAASTRVSRRRAHRKREGEGAEERPDNAESGSSDDDDEGRGRAEGKREKQEEASKRGPPSSEATVRTRRGIASHTGPSAGTGPRLNRDRNNSGALGPRRARARDRDNDRREPHTRLAHVRTARAVNTNRVFFILGATSSSSSSSSTTIFSTATASSRCCCCRRRRSPSRVSVSFSLGPAAIATDLARLR